MIQQLQLSETDAGLKFDLTLASEQRAYCFIGQNGAGKTVFLESLAQVLLYRHSIWRGASSQIRTLPGLFNNQKFRDVLRNQPLRVPDAVVDGQKVKQRSWGFTKLLEIDMIGGPVGFARPLVFVPATQRATIDGIGPAALSLVGGVMETFADVVNRLVDAVHRRPIEAATVSQWFASRLLVNPNFVVGLRDSHQEVGALLRLLVDFDRGHFEGVIQEGEGRTQVAVSFADGKLLFMGRPIDRLASGYVALIKILQEIVSSVAAWEAVRGSNDILGSDAVILIDEVDAHLHPTWQRRLLPFLKQSFPNATFFVTTHSPLVVRDTEPGEAYELVRTGNDVTARALGSPRDWYLSDVLSDAFHVDLPPVGAEGSEGTPSVVELLLDYSAHVKAFAASRNEAERAAALTLHATILPRLPADDPRLQSVAHLKQLLG